MDIIWAIIVLIVIAFIIGIAKISFYWLVGALIIAILIVVLYRLTRPRPL